MTLLQMTLSGSCIILLTAVLRKLALHRLPKQTFVALWMIAALRMLMPYELPSRWSIFALFSRKSAASTGERILSRAAAMDTTAIQMQVTAGVDWRMMIWLAGMLVCGMFFLLAWLRSMSRFRGASPMQSDAVEAFLSVHPLKRKVRVCCCEFVSAPLTYGLLRPVILLPENAECLEAILCHEWVHIRSLDVLKKAILVAAACVHWFNPLAWWMLSLANRDIELACDERVLSIFCDRRAYAMTLIKMEEARGFSGPMFNHFSQNQTEERIVAIMKNRNKSILSVILAALLVLGSAAAFATTAPDSGKELYAEYEPFGLIYNESDARLYFNGRLVRYFEDMYPADASEEAVGIIFSCSDGEVDVHAVRDLSGGKKELTGVEACSQEEFDARTIALHETLETPYAAKHTVVVTGKDGEVEYIETHPYDDGPTSVFITCENGEYTFSLNEDVTYSEASSIAIIGGADGPTSIYINADAEQASDGQINPEVFAEYEAFGLTVENNALYYENQRVRSFKDTYKVDFFRTISCEHFDEEGTIDVTALRDGSTLIGLEIAE